MTVNQKIDSLNSKFDAKFEALLAKLDVKFEAIDKRFDRIDERLDEHDQKIVDIGALHIELSHKIDTVIRQTADLPVIRDDIAYLKIKAALNENNISKINEQLIRMEAKDDYMLECIHALDERMDKSSTPEYA